MWSVFRIDVVDDGQVALSDRLIVDARVQEF